MNKIIYKRYYGARTEGDYSLLKKRPAYYLDLKEKRERIENKQIFIDNAITFSVICQWSIEVWERDYELDVYFFLKPYLLGEVAIRRMNELFGMADEVFFEENNRIGLRYKTHSASFAGKPYYY